MSSVATAISMIEREKLYQMLVSKDWDGIARVLHQNAAEISTDPVAQQAINFFESEFFNDIADKPDADALRLLEFPHIIDQLSRSAFSTPFSEKLIEEKIRRLYACGKESSALEYALQYPSLDISQTIIAKVDAKSPEIIADSIRPKTRVQVTAVVDGPPATRPLFRSKQEKNFFLAMRDAFPTYDPYPNVAINAVFDFNSIEAKLSSDEKKYFFRALIDSVVFDPNTEYTPRYFFELDSAHHDNSLQKRRDKMKNNIFQAANTKLYRIRALDNKSSSVEAFRQLILDLVRDL